MKSTRLVVLLTALVLTLLLSASALAAPVTLRWVYPGWDTKEQQAAVTKTIADFEASHPDIKIQLENYPWSVYHDKLIVGLQAQDGPDGGYVITRWLPELQAMGKLEDLTKLRKQLDLKDWFPTSWEDGKFNGKYYSVPDRREPYVFFYNKKLFAQAGIKEFPKTMDEFVAAAQKLTTDGRFGVGLVGAQDPTLAAYFINFLYAFNGSVLDSKGRIQVANADAIKALTFYTDLYRKHKVTQTSIVGDTREQVRNLFMTGQVAMMIDGLFAVGTFKQLAPNLDWGIGMIPKVSGKKQRCLETGWDTVLFTGGKHQKEAWEFVKFYTQAQNMAQAVVTLPVRKTAFESPRFKDASYDPWKQALAYGQPNPKTKYYERMMLAIGEAVQNALTGKMTPEKALKEAEKQIQQMESGL